MPPEWRRRWQQSRLHQSWSHGLLIPGMWSTILTIVLLGPALRPGFTLSYDMVFVPRQAMLPQSLGLGGGLPRAVPQDAVVAAVSTVVDGAWLQHGILLGIGILAGIGAARLVSPAGRGAQLVAATLAIWNPFVVERLVQGHWGFLWAYALTPWAVHTAIRMRQTGSRWRALIGWYAAAALVPSGGLLIVAVSLPIAVISRTVDVRRKVVVVAGAFAVNLPWILPALLHPDSGVADDAGARSFALREEGPWGPIITALGGGGLWNADAVPASRSSAAAVVLTVLVGAAATAGWRRAQQVIGRAATVWWTVLGGIGVVLASASALAPQTWAGIITTIPGGGLGRDAHKMLAPLVLLLAILAALGAARVASSIPDRVSRAAVIVAAALLPVALLPDAALGVGGRLAAVEYPAQWQQMRDFLAGDPRDGDVVVLPWSSFRQYDFNDRRTVLDPAPRWLTRSSIGADDLPVSGAEGIIVIPGDDPRSRRVAQTLASKTPLASVMPELGARWVLVEIGQRPQVDPAVLEGLDELWRDGDLAVLGIPDDSIQARTIQAPGWPTGSVWVIATDLGVLAGLVLLGLSSLLVRRRTRRGDRPG